LAIGYDSVDHESVESLFASDLQEFREGKSVSFYHGGQKCNVIVYLDVLVSLQDQPERRSSNSVMLGGSTYTACWGVSTNINAVASHVSACANCFSSLSILLIVSVQLVLIGILEGIAHYYTSLLRITILAA